MREDFKKFYDEFLNKWGYQAQSRMLIEEMSELTKELCKFERAKEFSSKEDLEKSIIECRQNIREELADVLNMAEQLEHYFGEDEVEKIREFKIERTLKKVK